MRYVAACTASAVLVALSSTVVTAQCGQLVKAITFEGCAAYALFGLMLA